MMHLGDYAEDYADLNVKFHTHSLAGVPTTLAGTPAVSCYKSNGTTQSTAGITLTADFDSVTGLNNVKVDLSSDAFYAVGKDYQLVITAGTVGGVSVVGAVIATFSIESRFNALDEIADAVFDEATAGHETLGTFGYQLKTILDDASAKVTILYDTHGYFIKLHLLDDDSGSKDLYLVTFHKDDALITSGITVPKIQVVKVADELDLIAETALTQVASLATYKKSEATNRISPGSGYVARITATIDGSPRSWEGPISRDASA
jgi:hypothetical protein